MIQHAASYDIYRKLVSLKDADYEIETPSDRLQLIRNKIIKELKLAHERSKKAYNTRRADVISSQIESYNAKLAPKHIKCIVLKVIGSSMYELEDSKDWYLPRERHFCQVVLLVFTCYILRTLEDTGLPKI